ncbi:hypothetical protein [Bosea sp. RAC05]|uniref:hypothetical protein n=1 Tax=Bosea sp. RAC05 TaxID=1842539 RepID=UPI000857804E|nr:hypothetical protein [Bosea sp. RAC05]AOG03477.1 hypothetical protein BSY19_5049 [Bosea sp. RAC05]
MDIGQGTRNLDSMARSFLIMVTMLACLAPAAAQEQPGPARAGSQHGWSAEDYAKACSPLLAESASRIRLRLLAFEPVFGKAAIKWSAEDYQKVVDLARACHGFSRNGEMVDGNNWKAMVEGARDAVLPVAEKAIQVDEYARTLTTEAIRLPACWRMADFKIDPHAMTDTSKEVFGQSFMQMSDSDLETAVKYVNECLLYLPDYAKSVKGWREAQGKELVGAIMDKALLILKRRAEWREWGHRETDLVINDADGAQIPPTMLSRTAREMVLRFNKAAALRRRFTPESISVLVKIADDVVAENKNAYDLAYAEAVSKRIQEEIFRRP